jgi:hypothetical protein
MNRQYPAVQTGHFQYQPQNNPVEMGKLGAVVGLCGAGAANLHRLRREEISGGEALVNTLKSGVATGIAAATAALVVAPIRSSSLSLVATLATGTAVMYMLNLESKEGPDD